MPMPLERLRAHLSYVYGSATAEQILEKLTPRLEQFRERNPQLRAAVPAPSERVDQRDVILITYGDQIQEAGKAPLQTLDETMVELAGDFLTGMHILPFYPYTSDDGFSVVDYREVNPEWGTWRDIQRLSEHFRLMFDAVINHISASSPWFQAFCRGEAPYTDYFIVVDPATDLTQVVRPRALPLLTPVETNRGVQHVWTTFSADQIDLNFAWPDLLIDVLVALLLYVEQGAQLIRLDAIGFMWKEIGTSCIHLPQAHALIQAMRALMDEVAPGVLLVTETNVPHAENVSYFGDGSNEAQMVYNFTLPPLTLHAFQTGDATHLTAWAAGLRSPSAQTTFFNFMASHDGIGLRPLEGILAREEVDAMVERVLQHGGLVSYKANPDGSKSPYELNIVYFDALNDPTLVEPVALQVNRFMASQAILLSLAGVPGIYVHSLFGSRNWHEGVAQTGHNRTINRRKFERRALKAALDDPQSIPHQVFQRYRTLIQARTGERAFHPNGAQQVLALNPACFCFVRTAPDGSSRVLCLHNVSGEHQTLQLSLAEAGFAPGASLHELITGRPVRAGGDQLTLSLQPYEVAWLRGEPA